MASLIENKFVRKSDRLDFSRSIFPYEKRHSTNLLSGMIVPVHTQFLYPGTTPDWNFGCVIESAPLISTNLDNIYVDVVCVWTPMRLVMTDWNEFLGESHSQAFTINRSITIPKLAANIDTSVITNHLGNPTTMSRAYYAEHYLGGHIGYRMHGNVNIAANANAESKFKKGISVIPSRIYELNWNTFFRNENIQPPILIDKTSSFGAHDNSYTLGLGRIRHANRLKTWYNIATPAPSLLDVSIGLGDLLPVITGADRTFTGEPLHLKSSGANTIVAGHIGVEGVNGRVQSYADTSTPPSGAGLVPTNLYAETAALTVNKMYYALMEQRFANKMMRGRRATEFYQNFFGITDSDIGHDMPQLLCQKRYQLNISQVIATGAGTNSDSQSTDLGQRGAFSTTGFGDSLVKNFTASEHGYIQTYLIIRAQPSIQAGIDHHLSMDGLLSTYLPEFDHIGPVGIETLEISDNYSNLYFGYTNAWYAERNQTSDVVGIIEEGEPLAYKTLSFNPSTPTVIQSNFIEHDARIIDKIFAFPVCYDTPLKSDGTTDAYGEPFNSNRYQFITQFVVKGKFAAVMSPDSEPLKLRM